MQSRKAYITSFYSVVSSEKLRTLMSGLSPALLRFGGSSADHTIFTKDLTSQDHLRAAKTHLSATAFTRKCELAFCEINVVSNRAYVLPLFPVPT